jgi:hypothetical protein
VLCRAAQQPKRIAVLGSAHDDHIHVMLQGKLTERGHGMSQ